MSAFCRDCLADAADGATRCAQCRGHRILAHPELHTLTIAHLDCDAFYAAIEKRDDPSLADKPVIVGGGKRGVVSTCCYIARIDGVRSAMPMFKALALCPKAVVIKPNMAKYVVEGKRVRAMMRDLTPMVQPLSLDEAYLDLSGTEKLHGQSPAKTMAALAKRIEVDIGISVSIGLSCNKFLAKLASELDKPRGFAVVGAKEAVAFLRDKPVGMIRGAGAALQARLAKDGITHIGQLQDADERDLARRYGSTGLWLYRAAHAQDSRTVDPSGEMKSISSETTFNENIARYDELEKILWRQCERVSARAKAMDLGGRTVTLKLRTAGFKIRTRSMSLDAPTQLADRIFRVAREMLKREIDGTFYRLIGAGLHNICAASDCDPDDLVDRGAGKRAKAEHAMDKVRAKFGGEAVGKGRGLRAAPRRYPTTSSASNIYGRYCVPRSSCMRPAARTIIAGKVWEKDTIRFVAQNCGNGDVVHAGAFFGDFLPGLSQALHPDARLWAFEPSRENFLCAQETVALNGLANVVLANAGLGARQGTGTLCVSAGGEAHGGASVCLSRKSVLARAYETVPIAALDAPRYPQDQRRLGLAARRGGRTSSRRWKARSIFWSLPSAGNPGDATEESRMV